MCSTQLICNIYCPISFFIFVHCVAICKVLYFIIILVVVSYPLTFIFFPNRARASTFLLVSLETCTNVWPVKCGGSCYASTLHGVIFIFLSAYVTFSWFMVSLESPLMYISKRFPCTEHPNLQPIWTSDHKVKIWLRLDGGYIGEVFIKKCYIFNNDIFLSLARIKNRFAF